MENNNWIVYLHIVPKKISNYEHDKYYVGITSQKKAEYRWKNGVGYKKNLYFYNAIQKYGWDNIEHEIVAENLTKEEAVNFEISLIKCLRSNNRMYGYNLTSGGDGSSGYVFSEEQLHKMSVSKRGKNNPFYGKKHLDKTKKIMSEKHYDCSGAKNPKAKPIYQFDIDFNFIKKYSSSSDADKELGMKCSGSAALQKSYTKNGYWAREEDIIDDNGNIRIRDPHLYTSKNEIFQFTKNWNYVARYISGNEAGRANNISMSNVNKAAKEKISLCGYYWVKKTDVLFVESVPVIKDDIKELILKNELEQKQKKLSKMVQVVNIENNKIFESYAQAAKHYDTNYNCIKNAAKQFAQGKNRTCKGYHWLRYDDYLKIYNLTSEEARKRLFFIV